MSQWDELPETDLSTKPTSKTSQIWRRNAKNNPINFSRLQSILAGAKGGRHKPAKVTLAKLR